MKRLLMKKMVECYPLDFLKSWKIFPLLLLFLLLSGSQAVAQLPLVTVRFFNPQYDCPSQTYCVDVEFISDSRQQLFGMNVRFFYDDDVLEYQSLGDFAVGYGSPIPPTIQTGPAGSGNAFGIAGPLEWFNGDVKLVSPSPIYLSSTWTKLFNVCFHVDDPDAISIDNFCPTIVWDLEENPASGGYLSGDNGVVITVVNPSPQQEAIPAIEHVVQFNWTYNYDGNPDPPYGFPVPEVCIPTTCGYVIPLSNWALVLAIGLMLVASVFIYRRRISG